MNNDGVQKGEADLDANYLVKIGLIPDRVSNGTEDSEFRNVEFQAIVDQAPSPNASDEDVKDWIIQIARHLQMDPNLITELRRNTFTYKHLDADAPQVRAKNLGNFGNHLRGILKPLPSMSDANSKYCAGIIAKYVEDAMEARKPCPPAAKTQIETEPAAIAVTRDILDRLGDGFKKSLLAKMRCIVAQEVSQEAQRLMRGDQPDCGGQPGTSAGQKRRRSEGEKCGDASKRQKYDDSD